MTSLSPIMPAARSRAPLAVGALATAILAIAAMGTPRAVLQGWLIAFASLGGVSLGASAWLLIHRLTGGRWGELARPAFVGAASALPLVTVALLPILLACRLVYPWAADPSSTAADVVAIYLNPIAVGLRGLVGMAGLGIAVALALRGKLRPLGAAAALIFYAIFMNFAAFDWLLSLDPRVASSAFGAQIIVQQLISGLAFAALIQDAPADHSAWRDIGALLLATTLGEAYLILMTFIVLWYGDQPDQAEWYLARTRHGWLWLELFGCVFCVAAPLLALMFGGVRDRAGSLRIVAAGLLLGVFIENVWLVSPVAEPWSAPMALLACVAMAGLASGLSQPAARLMGGRRLGR